MLHCTEWQALHYTVYSILHYIEYPALYRVSILHYTRVLWFILHYRDCPMFHITELPKGLVSLELYDVSPIMLRCFL
jgi:hypothetical protein